jgi:hypothetical protein
MAVLSLREVCTSLQLDRRQSSFVNKTYLTNILPFGRPPLQTSARRPAFVSDDFRGSHWPLQTTVTIVSFLILPNTYFIHSTTIDAK